MMMRAALVADGVVANVIEYDPEGSFDPGDLLLLVLSGDAPVGQGWSYDGANFSRPVAAPAPLPPLGALATLLAVVEVLEVLDAANAVGLTPGDLVTEALGWAAGAAINDTTTTGDSDA